MVRKPKTGDRTSNQGKTQNDFKMVNKNQSASAPQDKNGGPVVQHVAPNGDISYMYFTPRDVINFQT